MITNPGKRKHSLGEQAFEYISVISVFKYISVVQQNKTISKNASLKHTDSKLML